MDSERSIRSFWDQAAKDNPYWYVSSFGAYNADRNLEEFWASGRSIWSDIKRATGYSPNSEDTVVEIGCGVGRLTRAIAVEFGQVIAVDISENMLDIAKQANLKNVDFRLANGFTLPEIQDKSVNFVLGYCVFQHLPSNVALQSYLTEMCRITKSGGMIAFTLCPRDWTTWLLPLLRLRAYFRERLSIKGGPRGVFRKEWVGIRPKTSVVLRMSAIPLNRQILDAGRILYFGRA
jgi:SAM-dependent methyltransferase